MRHGHALSCICQMLCCFLFALRKCSCTLYITFGCSVRCWSTLLLIVHSYHPPSKRFLECVFRVRECSAALSCFVQFDPWQFSYPKYKLTNLQTLQPYKLTNLQTCKLTSLQTLHIYKLTNLQTYKLSNLHSLHILRKSLDMLK